MFAPESACGRFQCSSASRKFLNARSATAAGGVGEFQCSSASRKFLNPEKRRGFVHQIAGFSALQRAENSSIQEVAERSAVFRCVSVLFSEPKIPQFRVDRCVYRRRRRFQCSSASRKFLNGRSPAPCGLSRRFQCSSASRKFLNPTKRCIACLLLVFQCSSASRKFLNLFIDGVVTVRSAVFQCSSASRKFLNRVGRALRAVPYRFQCSSASRKFLNGDRRLKFRILAARFSALQRAENSSIERAIRSACFGTTSFSALQRAENSSIPTLAPASIHIPDCDDHASSFLSLPGASP